MSDKRFAIVPFILGALLALVPVARALEEADARVRPGVSFGGRAVFFHRDGGRNIDPITGASLRDDDFYGGAQLRFHLSRVLALEGSADYRQAVLPATRIDVYPVQASLLIYLTPQYRLTPFLLGGAGWYFTHVEGPSGLDRSQNRFGPHAGAGLQFFLSTRWSLDATYRYVWVEDVSSRSETNLADKDYDDRGHMATAAINFHF